MKKYKNVEKLKDVDFKRLTGVRRETFNKMNEILEIEYIKKHNKGGRKPKLSTKEQLLLTLEYLREYRTMFRLSVDYGISKSNVWAAIRWVEDTLIADGTFKLPGKKVLQQEEPANEIVLVDVTESPIERPQKNKKNGIQVKRKNIQ